MRSKYFKLSLIFIVVVSLALTGCARYNDLPPGTVQEIRGNGSEGAGTLSKSTNPVIESQVVTISPLDEKSPSADYIVGPYDVLSVNVSGKPEFSSMASAPGGSSGVGNVAQATGCRVDGSGNIQLPYIGTVHVWGMTLPEIQERLIVIYSKYLNDPWVIVDIREYRSQPIYLLGQFRNSGIFYMDRPLNLLEGIALGNGYDPMADLSAARLIRASRTIPVDIYELLTNGDQRQNIWLKPGDTIYIPDNRNRQVFVFGAVQKPGPIQLYSTGLTLMQAIASAQLRDSGYDLSHVRIIRSHSPTRGELIIVDVDKIMQGEAISMTLKHGDIIYVPKSAMGNWNDAIKEMLPTLQAISAILSPFVQIKYLAD